MLISFQQHSILLKTRNTIFRKKKDAAVAQKTNAVTAIHDLNY